MDPRERADAILARARARGAFVVTPESAVSPMDAASTLQIPRAVVKAADERDEDAEATMVVPGSRVRRRQDHDDELPAIAQEALTDVVATPPKGGKRQSANPRPPRELPQQVPAPDTVTMPMDDVTPEPEPEPEELDGLIPTVKQPPKTRSTLSQRLDG